MFAGVGGTSRFSLRSVDFRDQEGMLKWGAQESGTNGVDPTNPGIGSVRLMANTQADCIGAAKEAVSLYNNGVWPLIMIRMEFAASPTDAVDSWIRPMLRALDNTDPANGPVAKDGNCCEVIEVWNEPDTGGDATDECKKAAAIIPWIYNKPAFANYRAGKPQRKPIAGFWTPRGSHTDGTGHKYTGSAARNYCLRNGVSGSVTANPSGGTSYTTSPLTWDDFEGASLHAYGCHPDNLLGAINGVRTAMPADMPLYITENGLTAGYVAGYCNEGLITVPMQDIYLRDLLPAVASVAKAKNIRFFSWYSYNDLRPEASQPLYYKYSGLTKNDGTPKPYTDANGNPRSSANRMRNMPEVIVLTNYQAAVVTKHDLQVNVSHTNIGLGYVVDDVGKIDTRVGKIKANYDENTTVTLSYVTLNGSTAGAWSGSGTTSGNDRQVLMNADGKVVNITFNGGATNALSLRRPFTAATSTWSTQIPANPTLGGNDNLYMRDTTNPNSLYRQVIRPGNELPKTAADAYINFSSDSTPIYTVDNTTTKKKVFVDSTDPNMNGVRQVFDTANVGGGVPIPVNANSDLMREASGEGHIAVWNTDTDVYYEMFEVTKEGGNFRCTRGGVISDVSTHNGWFKDGLPTPVSSVTSSHTWGSGSTGLPVAAGTILFHNLDNAFASGNDTLPFTLALGLPSTIDTGWVWPAQRGDGTVNNSPPLGCRIQLNPTFDVTTLQFPIQKVIARTLQTYGAIVRTTTTDVPAFYLEDPTQYGYTYSYIKTNYFGGRDIFNLYNGGNVSTPGLLYRTEFPWDKMRLIKSCNIANNAAVQTARCATAVGN